MANEVRSARAAGAVSLAVFLSRILGLVRDLFFAKLFGAGLYNDAWLVAFRIPNLLRDLFAEGALSAAFVPTFTEVLRNQGRAQAWRLANLVLSSILVLLGAAAVLFLLGAELFVHGLAAGFSDVPGKVGITASLIRILSPFLMLIAMASVAMGVLNALGRFFLPALAPALFNLSLILAAIFMAPAFEARGVHPIYAMGAAAVLGGCLQFVAQVPLMRREGYRPRFLSDWRDPGMQRIRRLIAPAILGAGAVQINVLINTQIASFLRDNGPVSWLSYAFRVMYLPIGLFGVAVGVVNLREVSVFAAQGRFRELKETVANSIKLVSFLAVPSTVGLVVLAVPIIRILFERGRFLPDDTYFTAWALGAFALGLFAYSCNKVYVPTFYALNDTRTPVRITLVAVATNVTVNLILISILPTDYRFVGLALGTSASVTLSNFLLSFHLRKRLGSMREFGIAEAVSRHLVAALLMGGLIRLAEPPAWGWVPGDGLFDQAFRLLSLISVGLTAYLLSARILRVRELDHLLGALKRGSR
jgi:putative peptidoglycan lipid II flippase